MSKDWDKDPIIMALRQARKPDVRFGLRSAVVKAYVLGKLPVMVMSKLDTVLISDSLALEQVIAEAKACGVPLSPFVACLADARAKAKA